ncbi:hypothetical protein ABZ319_34320 [Nocardia sp. NPDC005978]|uniref:hypothetical protein n=1 Tax=Nocardia sp. NPDC005978 TaxID=3156725 RepID=UPI0033ACB234
MLALFGTGCAMVAVDENRYYRIDFVTGWIWLTSWTLSFALLGAFASRLARRRAKLLTSLSLCLCLLIFPVWWLALRGSDWSNATPDSENETVLPSPYGRVEVVLENYRNFFDPSCRVWLREPDGLFARRILIWQEVRSNCPRVAFPDSTTVSLTPLHGGPTQTTTFDPDRMRVTGPSPR